MRQLGKVFVLLAISLCSQAGNQVITSAKIVNLTYFGVEAGQFPAGSFGIELQDSFSAETVNCNGRFLHTPAVNDPDGRMFSILITAKASNSPISIGISDAAALNAVSGRCSIRYVTIE
jgi:hypothetical protein